MNSYNIVKIQSGSCKGKFKAVLITGGTIAIADSYEQCLFEAKENVLFVKVVK